MTGEARIASQVVAFGHGVPLSDPALAGLAVADVTREPCAPRPGSRIAPLSEPFLDPIVLPSFSRSRPGPWTGRR